MHTSKEAVIYSDAGESVGKQEIVLENGDGERYDWMNSLLYPIEQS
jgi:hypothetical protein